ncbi:hypothetical protein BKA82DRAFT_1000049 [Pisolithus tinctorius]|uniref:Uncharacterized protein n=1 Tax=Pisolithus tinctorius Marx 270 TaxID=870435 RepID=A0A0C3PAM5_PISTI|nr:hypothetical protein BKA82DRAFT_1000049 [Pisolithus tinctorius]KIO04966.1 hypothetical protein M404DRAFT_1000049 [Pisolithus tinctorius Marx 270]
MTYTPINRLNDSEESWLGDSEENWHNDNKEIATVAVWIAFASLLDHACIADFLYFCV